MKYEIIGDDLVYDIGNGKKTLYLNLFIDYMKDAIKEGDLFSDAYSQLFYIIKIDHPELFI